MTTFYVDLSEHDWNRNKGEFNFAQVAGTTSKCVVVRATYGDPGGYHYPTYHFGDMQTMAKNAGFSLRGGYHNLVRGDQASINRQVDWLRSELDKVGANWAMADVERYSELLSDNMWPRWEDVQRFHDRWYSVESRVMAWYVPDWVWEASLGSHSLTGLRGPLIASEYGDNRCGLNPSQLYSHAGGDSSDKWHAYGGRTPEILQYGSCCVVSGASSQTDVNAFRGTFDQLSTLLLHGGDDVSAEEVWDHSMENGTHDTTLNAMQNIAARTDYLANKGGVSKQTSAATMKNVGGAGKTAPLDESIGILWDAVHTLDGRVTTIDDKLNQIIALLSGGTTPPSGGGTPAGPVDLTPAAVAAVAEAVVDEEHARLAE